MEAMGKKRTGKDVLYPDLSYRIMEAAFEVHNQLGPGFPETIYERALLIELAAREISCLQQVDVPVCYKGQDLGAFRLDLVVEGKIILELKALSSLNDLSKQQLRSYLKASGLRLGILINFGAPRVESVRIVN
jgi:GxxExxY protein